MGQLASGVTLPFDPAIEVPSLHELALRTPAPPPINDLARAAPNGVIDTLARHVSRGMTVAVGCP